MYKTESEDRLSFDEIKSEFERIKSLGFIKSNRIHNTGIGKTFEDHLGVKENNIKNPDFGIFEVKSQRDLSTSYVTLTTKEPNESSSKINDLRILFGKPDLMFPNLTVLHTSFFADKQNTCNSKFCFKLENDSTNKKIYIVVKDISKNNIINDKVYYTYTEIEDSLLKLKNLFFVSAKCNKNNDIEEFHYISGSVYLDLQINKFYELLNEGKIMYDIRFGAYKTGKMAGKLHNHGCGFRIKKENFKDLYHRYYTLD